MFMRKLLAALLSASILMGAPAANAGLFRKGVMVIGGSVIAAEVATITALTVAAITAVNTPQYQAAVKNLAMALAKHPHIGPEAFDRGAAQVAEQYPSLAASIPVVEHDAFAAAQLERERIKAAASQPAVPMSDSAGMPPDDDDVCKPDETPKEKLSDRRNQPGVASGGETLRRVSDGEKWRRGTERNAGLIPGQIAERLRGQRFNNWDDFRKAIWREVGNDATLGEGFRLQDVGLMKNGNAPYAAPGQFLGKRMLYEIHHRLPIARGGDVYSFDNLAIVTPRCHKEIMNPGDHGE